MKNVIKNAMIPLLFFLVIFSSSIYSTENKWNLEIKLDKQNYISLEPIWLDIELLNNTSETIRTQGLIEPNNGKLFIVLKDSNGESVEYTGPKALLADHPGRLFLEPGEMEYESFDLTFLFASFKDTSGYSVFIDEFRYIPKGTYTVQVSYEDNFSNELTFNIVEPSGDEKEALEMIEDAYGIWRQDNPYPSAKKFKEIVERFPNSVFAEICYYQSRFYSKEIWDGLRGGLFEKSMRILKMEMIENYPNSGRSKGWLMAITHEMDDSTKMNFINKLKEANPKTRSAKFIKQMQRRIDKKKVGE